MASNRPSSSPITKSETTGRSIGLNSRISSASVTKEKCKEYSNENKTTSNMEMFACFWIDQNLNKIKDFEDIKQQLRKMINHLRTFEHVDQCEQMIKDNTQDKIILICSNSFGQKIIPRIHHLTQFNAAYIFDSQENIIDKNWISIYTKVKGIYRDRCELIARLSEDQKVRIKVEDSVTISVLSRQSETLEVLIRMHHLANHREEFVKICKENYKDNHYELEIINEFNLKYPSENAIWWYTRESYLYRILNKALRIQDFQMLFSLGFFLTDLSKCLKEEYERYLRETSKRDLINVYRGQGIDLDELKLIQSNIGQFLSMNSFLSTSLERRTAISFLDNIPIDEKIHRILFEINIDPKEKTRPFCNIKHLSYFKDEDEILIMLGALFRIQSVSQEKTNQFWIVNLKLSSEDDFSLKETYFHLKQKIGNETNLHSLGKICIEMGQYKQAQIFYQKILYQSELDQSLAYSGLGLSEHWLNQYDQAIEHLNKSLALIENLLPHLSEEKGRLFSSIGLIYWRKKQYEYALTYLNKALDIQQMILSNDHPDLLATYNRFAITYSALDHIQMALEYYYKCLNIRLSTLPHDHPDIATSYNNIGWLYYHKINDYQKALEYFEKALTICRKILPPTHRDIIRTEQNILKVKQKLNN